MKNVRIVNIKKFIRGIIVLSSIIIAIVLFLSKVTLSHNDDGKINYETISIAQGDTLWKIATEQQETNPYYTEKDVRFVLNEIKKINNLCTSDLQIGQELRIPVL